MTIFTSYRSWPRPWSSPMSRRPCARRLPRSRRRVGNHDTSAAANSSCGFMREQAQKNPQQVAEQLLDRFGREFERPNVLELILERDGKLVAKFNLDDTSAMHVTERLRPGAYCLRCDTGRVLWEGRLADSDLLWAKAFPGQPLKMAADTGHSRAKPTQSIELLHGRLGAPRIRRN